MLKNLFTLLLILKGFLLIASPLITSEFIKIDQFGYRSLDQKIAVISDPEIGFNSALSFNPGTTYQIRDWNTDAILFSGTPSQWNSGAIHAQSGDRVWYFDFTSFTQAGSFYVFDEFNNVGSFRFEINDCVYSNLLSVVCKANYYQRCGIAKTTPFAESPWTDNACHIGANQDTDCRLWSDPTNVSLSKDLSGGWHDAGDYNKYVNYAWDPVIDLLLAYEEHPEIWDDNYGIPESNNGIPDILDEVKYELDWLLKMQQTDGSVLCVVGTNNFESTSPPSAGGYHRFYGPATTCATYSAAGMFALASIQFKALGELTYASQIEQAAINAWNWANANPGIIFHNNTQNISVGPINYLAAGDQEPYWSGFTDYKKITAAIFLFALTNQSTYKSHIDANFGIIPLSTTVNSDQKLFSDALLYYTKTSGATLAVSQDILTNYTVGVSSGTNNLPAFLNQTDAYRALISNYDWDIHDFISTYDWGSNTIKGHHGALYNNMIKFNLNSVNAQNYINAGSGFLHYFHGVNPLGKTYLSNMSSKGAENSIQSFYNAWFDDGTIHDTNPAPGFTVMGANELYDTYTCCVSNCEVNCFEVDNLMNDPAQKCYKDFNSHYPFASWTISENQILTQASYIRLLSQFCNENCSSLNIDEKSTIKLAFFPNPTTSTITFNFDEITENEQIKILNTCGEVVFEGSVSHSIDLSALTNGIYYIHFTTLGQTQKLIKIGN